MTGQSTFELYLRTGLRARPGVELKFNPWHDPLDGRFTFAPGGRARAQMAENDRR